METETLLIIISISLALLLLLFFIGHIVLLIYVAIHILKENNYPYYPLSFVSVTVLILFLIADSILILVAYSCDIKFDDNRKKLADKSKEIEIAE